MAIVDDIGSQFRLLKRNVERVASAHAPADGTNTVFLHIGLRLQVLESGVQVTFGAVFRDSTHAFMGLFGSSSDFAAIKIEGQRGIALIGEFRGLLFDPIVESPELVDHDDTGERSYAFGSVEDCFYCVVATLVGNVFGGGCQCGLGKQSQDYK